MAEPYILGRMSHGNEPIFIAMSIAAHFPDAGIVLPVHATKKGLVTEIAEGKEIDKRRVYIDTVAAGLASAYGVLRENGIRYEDWVANNLMHHRSMKESLRNHYRSFFATNLEGEERMFKNSDARVILNAGDLYDDFGFDTPVVYVFPLRHSEVLKRSKKAGLAGFGDFLQRNEKKRSVNFIPRIHSLCYGSYRPLDNEEFTPHIKEEPVPVDIALPDHSIAMVFSGTGRKVEELKAIATHTQHPVVTGRFSLVEGDRYVKLTPPRAEFVHVYARPEILAVVGQAGYGMLWSAWNAGKPVVFPAYEKGDDEEFIHNAKTIKKFGLGVEIKKPEHVDAAIEEAQACMPAIEAINAKLQKEFGTLDGPAYIAKRVRQLGLY